MTNLSTETFTRQFFEWIRTRRETEMLTEETGAVFRRRMIFPNCAVEIGPAHADDMSGLRSLLGGGDIAEIHGPTELIVITIGSLALSILDALFGTDRAEMAPS